MNRQQIRWACKLLGYLEESEKILGDPDFSARSCWLRTSSDIGIIGIEIDPSVMRVALEAHVIMLKTELKELGYEA